MVDFKNKLSVLNLHPPVKISYKWENEQNTLYKVVLGV